MYKEPEPSVCECDLNADGNCNGLDWLAFYPGIGEEMIAKRLVLNSASAI